MFDFRKIQLDDREWINECLKISDFRGCEYSFANNMAWQRLNDTQICREDGFYISCSQEENQPFVTFPSGEKTDEKGREKYIKLFEKLKSHFENMGKTFVLSSVTDENLLWLKEYYGEKISSKCYEESCDYIYNSTDLINFSGKKYHGKRNHLKHFYKNNWSFREFSPEYTDDCISFCTEIYNADKGYTNFSKVVEQYAINLFFSFYKELDLKIGILFADEKIVGVSVGEQLNSDTFDVHIEKADTDFQGSYPAICTNFAKNFAGNFRYINREEDLGIEGLRKSKQSYHPEFLLRKNIVAFN